MTILCQLKNFQFPLLVMVLVLFACFCFSPVCVAAPNLQSLYHFLTLSFDKSMPGHRILAQDLAGDSPQDITQLVHISGSQIMIPGVVIDRIGRSAATPGDKSDPGLVLVIRTN